MMVIHPCAFHFKTTDIRRIGNVVDGGTSISGFNDSIETDGGGFWRADFSDGITLTREEGNAWRAIGDACDNGATAFTVILDAERLFQPVGARVRSPHSDMTPFSDESLYVSSGADYTAAAADLRAVSLTISGVSEKPIIGGELFSIHHPVWGWRVYRVRTIVDGVITFRPPLREAIDDDTNLEFDTPRCQMRLAQAVGNPTDLGRTTTCAMSFVEDMRKPPE